MVLDTGRDKSGPPTDGDQAAARKQLKWPAQSAALASAEQERQHFLRQKECPNRKQQAPKSGRRAARRRARLAKQEESLEGAGSGRKGCAGMAARLLKRKRVCIPLIIVSFMAAIYCLPFVDIEPQVARLVPRIPFNFRSGPLAPDEAGRFKQERLFQDRLQGAESVALDAQGNMYLAVEGGFILYVQLNASSPARPWNSGQLGQPGRLIKIAELNGLRPAPYESSGQRASRQQAGGVWRRECQLDEQLYGSHLFHEEAPLGFVSHVRQSRCSTPLGIRLSADETHLYVIDTLSGLYRVQLNVAERPHSSQRLVTRLLEFGARWPRARQLLPISQMQPADDQPEAPKPGSSHDNNNNNNNNNNGSQPAEPATQQAGLWAQAVVQARTAYLNVSLMAVDDLVIDQGERGKSADVIYLSVGSQKWMAHNYLYDLIEGRPSGILLRYDTGSQRLSVLDPIRLARVRTSGEHELQLARRPYEQTEGAAGSGSGGAPLQGGANLTQLAAESIIGIGAPRLDENDVFDDRPLFFPNGVEITDDKQALLIADTSNHRIIKHYIRGHLRGTSHLWAWTPNFPDNIRRGYDKQRETYWVAGCGEDMSNKPDLIGMLNKWPSVRKYILKNVYLFGWFMEAMGQYVFRSSTIRDFGFSIKSGQTFLQTVCAGMMTLQYNEYGDLIRSFQGKESPAEVYSQVNEIIDAKNEEHVLYLSSPVHRYITKLILPTDNPNSIHSNLVT